MRISDWSSDVCSSDLHDAHVVLRVEPAELQLEVDQPDAGAEEESAEIVVHAQRQVEHVVQVLRRRPAERGDVLLRHQRIAQLVRLVVIFRDRARSEEHTSELQSLMRISYAVFCLKKKKKTNTKEIYI